MTTIASKPIEISKEDMLKIIDFQSKEIVMTTLFSASKNTMIFAGIGKMHYLKDKVVKDDYSFYGIMGYEENGVKKEAVSMGITMDITQFCDLDLTMYNMMYRKKDES